jgi:aminoglycoside 3-N-acetyltransferase
MAVTLQQIRHAVQELGLARQPLCVHASLRSFGWVEGGPSAIIDGLLAEGCTVLVPTFSWVYAVPPPPNDRPPQNGWDYDRFAGPISGIERVYTPSSREGAGSSGAGRTTLNGTHVRGGRRLFGRL